MLTGKFGRYEIKSEIARGGMATVYHAYDPVFERNIAIKVLPRAMLHDPEFRTRFEREAKVIGRLEHPAIVPVYDFGEEDQQPFIIMRYMSGGSLSERIERGPMGLGETASIIDRLATALDASHALDIIHRDIKPGNVLFDRYGNAYLSDFGIARIVTEDQVTTITGGSIIGTPAYMSPEQIQGDKIISGRSDIYALGILVYQMLTGTRPYEADTPAQILMKHIMDPIPNILTVRPDLPESTSIVIAKALAKEPEARYVTVAEFASALNTVSQGGIYRPQGDDAGILIAPEHPDLVKASAVTVLTPQTDAIDATKVSIPQAEPSVKPISKGKGWFWILLLILILGITVIIIGGLVFMGLRGSGLLALYTSDTNTPISTWTKILSSTSSPTDMLVVSEDTSTAALIQPPSTEEPTLIPSETTLPTLTPPIIGGADKIAFLLDGEIWSANLDGSELEKHTNDGTLKKWLSWASDGNSILYITGKCVKSITLDNQEETQIACFNNAGELKSFQVSPDGKHAAISLDNQLYLVPFDRESLAAATKHADLREFADCEHFAHYQEFFVKSALWSDDSNALGAIIMGSSGDMIHVFSVDQCVARPDRWYTIPRSPYPEDYKNSPSIKNFGWDGNSIYTFNTHVRRSGFGNLYRYNMGLIDEGKIFSDMINPIEGKCCYRDSIYSPDGRYLLFAYQDSSTGVIQFYMIEDALIGTGINYQPLPLPELSSNDENAYPIFRPVREQ